MPPPLTYQEYATSWQLADRVECLWTVRSAAALPAPTLARVLPDGCMDLIFNLGDPPLGDGVRHHELQAYVVGAMTRALSVRHIGRVHVLGVRFRPGQASSLLGVAAAELRDSAITIDDISPRLARAACAVREATSDAAARRALVHLLETHTGPADATERLAALAWEQLRASAGALSIRDLAMRLGVAERKLQRLFHDRVGLTPKETARTARLQAALALVRRPELPLGRVAVRAGYYDQPHFNREFARLTGTTPERWRKERDASVQAPTASRT